LACPLRSGSPSGCETGAGVVAMSHASGSKGATLAISSALHRKHRPLGDDSTRLSVIEVNSRKGQNRPNWLRLKRPPDKRPTVIAGEAHDRLYRITAPTRALKATGLYNALPALADPIAASLCAGDASSCAETSSTSGRTVRSWSVST